MNRSRIYSCIHSACRCSALLLTLLLLGACGGGGGSSGGNTSVVPDSASAPAAQDAGGGLVSIESFQSGNTTTNSSGTAPSADSLANFVDAANAYTLDVLHAEVQGAEPDAIATSPVLLSSLQLLAAGARGSSADEFDALETRLGPRDQWATLLRAALQDAGPSRSLGASADATFLPAFLQAAFNVASVSIDSHVYVANPDARLSVIDRVNVLPPFDSVEAFTGIYANGTSHYQAPMLRVTTGAKRLDGTDFTADRLDLGDGKLRLVSIRPVGSNTLASLGRARLGELVAQVSASAAADLQDLALVLPARAVSFASIPALPSGIASVFDPSVANLTGVAPGGNYFVAPNGSAASFALSAQGIDVQTMQAYSFIRDAVDPGSTSDVTVTSNGGLPRCYPADQAVDLGPQLLVLLNRNTGMMIAAVQLGSSYGTWLGDEACLSPS